MEYVGHQQMVCVPKIGVGSKNYRVPKIGEGSKTCSSEISANETCNGLKCVFIIGTSGYMVKIFLVRTYGGCSDN